MNRTDPGIARPVHNDQCGNLAAREVCFRVKRYVDGEVEEVFHEHVPKHRISEDNSIALARTLLAKYRSLQDIDILRSYLNRRGNEPSAMDIGQFHVDFPEPGVLRKCLSYRDIWISFDQVINEDKFRHASE